MLPATYLDINLSLARAKERAGIDISDVDKDPAMRDLLELSAGMGTDQGGETIKVFRPYFVAAKTLQQDIARQQLRKAGDAEFTGVLPVIQSLFNQQAAIDNAENLSIPPGMEAPIYLGENQLQKRNKRGFYTTHSLPINFGF